MVYPDTMSSPTSPGFGGASVNAITRPDPKQALAAAAGPSAGPFGYTEKVLTFFDNSFYTKKVSISFDISFLTF